jgi:primosomal protein N' (replication factor Y)
MMALIGELAVAAPLDKTLSYRVPDELRDQVCIGMRLRVPLGRRSVVGYLLGLSQDDASHLKPVQEVLDDEPLFSPDMAAFFRRAAAYYRHPLGEVIRTALPAGLSGGSRDVSVVSEQVYRPVAGQDKPRGPRQREILQFLHGAGEATRAQVLARFPACQGSLQALVRQGFVGREQRERRRDPFAALAPPADRPVTLTGHQAEALAAVEGALASATFRPMLLHGVTGSGKTEVYLQAIERALAAGRQALVLVPEIALTPQLVSRFRARFADGRAALAVMHSGLSAGERYDAWRSVARGQIDIVIGARSAVFAPLEKLGIVIVDEEHEASYKQGDGFRYHARDLALLRAQMSGAVALLGSATPALTTFQRAREGKTDYLVLPERVLRRPLPEVEIVDLSEDRPEGVLSARLQQALVDNLARKEQSLLLLNRRGFAPYLLCGDCGAALRCPHCDITLTYYLAKRELRCNYCDYRQDPPDQCPACRGSALQPEGAGTERLEQELRELLPEARVARMDRDTTGRKGAHQALVDAMERREIDILVGTQMVAKGLDFPGVTLVGVMQTDNLLNLPDFRAAERAFTLLTQVAGRAGRGERPGRVLVQTYAPDHFALACCLTHDYQAFADQELAMRQELGYPPFGFLVNCVLAGNDPERTGAAAADLTRRLAGPAARLGVEVLGPAPCPLSRLRGKSRFQILLKSSRRPALHHLLAHLPDLRRGVPSGVGLAVDVDPLDML